MGKIKWMPDDHGYPIWGMDDDNKGNVHSSALPVSKALADGWMQWVAGCGATLNSSFSSTQTEWRFKDQGEKPFDRLRLELSNGYLIVLSMA